eukprot:CAMPEP_0114350160 /NCGR_PEP_ID=MMETSP0101-20121206/16126_1 /TAXON_ID=38822 ORGANISM="Pteridomonas danica, Strain PT" /NCGR_SAMPLE_ID=MMETSP0101 /ASSEMBLY_ACC=CAM_ASM_000211 /LENGTH=493 /DNA_ID=CAMNT_0001489199 /DNA_START=246 /DNA_END=1727 /DNA_ORIENTATION=-
MTLKSFSAIDPDEANENLKIPSHIKVGFVDAEGQGDRDTAYDARIACPILLSARCVLFNWRDSLQKDRILDLLGVMCRAANSVNNDTNKSPVKRRVSRTDSTESDTVTKPFGHLHIVFRDWNFDGDRASVESQLFDLEEEYNPNKDNDGEGSEQSRGQRKSIAGARLTNAAKRNAVRKQLVVAFESITVWLMPPPTERTKDLKKILTDDLISEDFTEALKSLRSCLVQQCTTPRLFANQEVTGPRLSFLIPKVVDTLNKNELVLPSSAYEAMVRTELDSASKIAKLALRDACNLALEKSSTSTADILKTALDQTTGRGAFLRGARDQASAVLDQEINAGLTSIVDLFKAEMISNITEDRAILEEELTKLQESSAEDVSKAKVSFNRTILWPFSLSGARARLEALCRELTDDLPKPEEELQKAMDECLGATKLTLKVDAEQADLSNVELENAISSISDRATLLIQELFETNKQIKADKRILPQVPSVTACCIVS